MLITTKSNTELNHFHHRTGARGFDDVAWLAGTLLTVIFGKLQVGGQSFGVDLERLRLRLSPARSIRWAL